jgi:hypothetical protein
MPEVCRGDFLILMQIERRDSSGAQHSVVCCESREGVDVCSFVVNVGSSAR